MTDAPTTREMVPAITRAIATALGAGWRSVYHPEWTENGATLEHEDGRSVFAALDRYGNASRWKFRGCAPEELRAAPSALRPRGSFPSITCVGSKEPAALAKEITRRLLPTYNVRYAETVATCRQIADAIAARDEVATVLATLLGMAAHSTRDGRVWFPTDFCGRAVEVHRGGHLVTFDQFTVPTDLARAIIEVLKAHAKRQ